MNKRDELCRVTLIVVSTIIVLCIITGIIVTFTAPCKLECSFYLFTAAFILMINQIVMYILYHYCTCIDKVLNDDFIDV